MFISGKYFLKESLFVATTTLSLPSTKFVATWQAIKEQNGTWNPIFLEVLTLEHSLLICCFCILFVYFQCRILAMSTKCPGPGPRKAIPHHIDSITKELKYVDPAHRNCVPGFKAASFTPKKKKDKYHGRTHNCIASMRMTSGDMYAVRIILHLSMWIVFSYHEGGFLCGILTTPILLCGLPRLL